MTWTLVVFALATGWDYREWKTVATVAGFTSQADCEEGGQQARDRLKPLSGVDVRHICVATGTSPKAEGSK
jgi:hypothetical protein